MSTNAQRSRIMTAARIGRLGCYAFAVLITSSPAFAQSVDRAEVEKIVREYILKNPEIIGDALTELERRAQTAETLAKSEAISAETDALQRSNDDVTWKSGRRCHAGRILRLQLRLLQASGA